MTCVKIMTDMPLPTPRSVISSPIHMITAVPATIAMTIVAMWNTDAFGMIGLALMSQPGNSVPLRASSMYPVDCRIARPMVRYLVYCVIFAWPAWPSFFSVSSRGMTTVSNWRMMLAVMYGMMPSANTDMYLRALPLSRSMICSVPAMPDVAAIFEQYETFASLMPGAGSDEPNRNKAIMPSVKSSFLRRSGVRNALMNAVSMRDPSSSADPAFERLPYLTRRYTQRASSLKGLPLERASFGCVLSTHFVVA